MDEQIRPTQRRRSIPWSRILLVLIPMVCIAVPTWLTQHDPPFYTQLLAQDGGPGSRTQSDLFISKMSRLISDIRNDRNWQETFTQDMVNGWLAVDFRENHAERSLPATVTDPRLVISGNEMQMAFRVDYGILDTVVHANMKVWVPKTNVLALQFDGVWAGSMPIPGSYVRQIIEQFAELGELDIIWKRNGRHLVALLSWPHDGRAYVPDVVEIRQGEIYVEGSAKRPVVDPSLSE